MSSPESAAERRIRLVRANGYNGLAFLTLYDGWRYFEPAGIEGFVAFELHRTTAVACGDPVCAEGDLRELLSRFAEYCAQHGWRFSFIGASARVGTIANGLGYRALKIGEEPFFDLRTYSLRGRSAKKARSAINLARRTGITVEEYRRLTPAIDSEIDEISRDWLASRKAPPMGFLLRSRPLARRELKRTFIASHEGRVVGVLTCAPAPAREMLYVEEQLRRPDAPYGTTELLFEEARTLAQSEGVALMSLGTAPMQGAEKQPFRGFAPMKVLVRAICSRFNFIYSFRSLNHFKKKLAPTFWEDNFLIYRGSVLPIAFAAAAAFAPEGIPSLILPKRMQWLRFVPGAALWTAAVGGMFATGFAAWEFPVLQLPVRVGFHGVLFARIPAGLMIDATQLTLLAHRLVSTIVLAGLGVVVWRRRARA